MLSGFTAGAQSPVDELIVRYAEVKGARDFVARGSRMSLVRGLLRNYPLAPVADQVEDLYVLKMEKASDQDKADFLAGLQSALKSYEYYGKFNGKNGLVDVYVFRSGPETVSELVIYNPEIYSLNSLGGHFSVSSLLSLDMH